jgi:hypothetical protein
MRQVDMSRDAVTARLKLVSELRRLCLSLKTAKIKTGPAVKPADVSEQERLPTERKHEPK